MLSVLETSMQLWPCSSALLILCAIHVLLMYLPLCPSRSTTRQCCLTPALQSRARLLIPAFTPPPRKASPGALLPQPPTDHFLSPVSDSAHSTNNEDRRVFVTISFRNDDVVTAKPFSASFPGRRPPSRAQQPEPRGTRQARAITPPTAPLNGD